ncbi:uncharacterized protein XM38_035800 [Halomicronema hongdechloris C2206]|uniref:SnoaL-like domain-containing protein n=1 Tax=Halomicronema hongdechloris C2206 TaxID=1641165 RepID=A0A1Z3HQU1_9CYAN|nr:nuclear transport factor 2 family protein [Halomicronema hongdechloris]ASC72622.1 uncharacterized protein XM38_035800 [Halomicronema hongdechloris C2206]
MNSSPQHPIPADMSREHPNVTLIQTFYTCFNQRDHKGMMRCYHPEIHFSDALFDLNGDAVAAMWYMFCRNAMDLQVILTDAAANEHAGIAHWEATYHFSETGRQVHNIVAAQFDFKAGKIIRHHDDWDFWQWSDMALGATGRFLGWTPVVKNATRKKAGKKLADFIESLSAQETAEYRILGGE